MMICRSCFTRMSGENMRRGHETCITCPKVGEKIRPWAYDMDLELEERRRELRVERWVLCDLDGVLSLPAERMKDFDGDWSKFHRRFAEDSFNLPVLSLLRWWAADHYQKIAFITSRPERYRESTIAQIQLVINDSFELYMRPNLNHEPSAILKARHLRSHFRDRPERVVAFAIDDHPEVCWMYEKTGIPVMRWPSTMHPSPATPYSLALDRIRELSEPDGDHIDSDPEDLLEEIWTIASGGKEL